MEAEKRKEHIKFIETAVYSLLIVVVIFASFYGPIYIRILPLLFLLGAIGNVFFGRPVITTIFGIITSICVVHMKEKYGFFENIFISFNFGLSIVLGEIAGDLIKRTYKLFSEESAKSKASKKKEITMCIITAVFLFVVCPLVHGAGNGNFLRYYRAKNKLNDYLASEYEEKASDFKIKDAEYIALKDTNYTFKIEYEGSVYNFRVYTNEDLDVVDGYKQSKIDKNNSIIKEKLRSFMRKNESYNGSTIEFNEKSSVLSIKYETENIDESYDEMTDMIIFNLELLKDFEYADDIENISVLVSQKNEEEKYKSASINFNTYRKIDEESKKIEYISSSFDIEYIDE